MNLFKMTIITNEVTPILANEGKKEVKSTVELQSWFSSKRKYQSIVEFVKEHEDIVDMVENYTLFWMNLARSRSIGDTARATILLCKTITKKSMVNNLVDNVFVKTCLKVFDVTAIELQGDWFLDGIDGLENIMGNYDKIKGCKLFEKFASVCAYSAMFGLYQKMGLPIKTSLWDLSQSASAKRTLFDAPDFAKAVADLILYALRQGRQSYLHGSVMHMFHSGENYEAWLDKVSELTIQAKHLSNPEALQEQYPGFTECKFIAELKDAIEKGKSMFSVLPNGPERRYVAKMLMAIKEIDANHLTKQAAQEYRAAPLGVFVYGYPGIGKSTVMDILYSYFAKIRGLPCESKYMYTKNSAAKFWDGFASYMWCVVLDDVACFRAAKVQGIDESVQEVIKVINTIPYTPDQAALEDKGRTPVKAQLVFATSNVHDMNLNTYFEKSGAAFRRFGFRIKPSVKPQYATASGMLDSSKVPTPGENMYDDLWTFEVHEAQTYDDMGGSYEDPKPLLFPDIKSLLLWYRQVILTHFRKQEIMLSANKLTRSVEVCGECGLPSGMCDCCQIEIQNRCVSCADKMRCVLCSFCECVCKCAPAHRIRYNPLASQRAIEAITPGQIVKAKRLEQEYVEYVRMIERENEDIYYHDPEDVYDCTATFIDKQITEEPTGVCAYLFKVGVRVTLYLVFEYDCFRNGGKWLYSFPMVRRLVHRHVAPKIIAPSIQKLIMRKMGNWVDRRLGKCRFSDMIITVVSSALAIGAFVWIMKKIFAPAERADDPSWEEDTVFDADEIAEMNAAMQVKVVPPVETQRIATLGRAPVYEPEETENPWYNDKFVLTKFDVSTKTHALDTKSDDEIAATFQRNICRIDLAFVGADGEAMVVAQNAVCVGGRTYLVNSHALQGPTDDIEVRLTHGSVQQGVNTIVRGRVTYSNIVSDTKRDLSVVNILTGVPCKDIRKFFAPRSFDGHFDGFLITVLANGTLRTKRVQKIRKQKFVQKVGPYSFDCMAFSYSMDTPTTTGDCGSLLVVRSGFGPQLVGYHFGYDALMMRGYATQVCSEDFAEISMQSDFPIMSPGEPLLSAPGYEFVLGELAERSPARYIEKGTATVFGSFVGNNRANTKSKVCATPLCSTLLKLEPQSYPRFELREGAPSMHPWKPWRIALCDMVDPVTQMKTATLQKCARAFLEEILGGLSSESMKELHPYDLGTAVNGAPGLKFVDKMNRATSMGHPFNTTKKSFLRPLVSDRWADGVEFDEVVLERVEKCVAAYHADTLFCPVFGASLKDEPKAKKKIAAHKTRVFTPSPADWSVVVRMYYLPLIRCVQKNKFLFESGPGTNSHSLEWEEIREFLVQHGEDKMIAGDYASFDKKMATNATMYAYWIMIEVLKASGNYSEDDVKVLWGVAMDTCYPTVNFNGDLIQFHCGNPSGQPLTVILNGFVNALYLRYVYAELGYDVKTFKENVSLMTYGDDNAMGVSDEVPLFNHTNIQAKLADVGIGYTMADKEAESVPYIHISEVSFLKRVWRYEPEVDAYVAPLEWASINKMLTVHVRSKSTSANEQIVAACTSAVCEAFYHGREQFEELSGHLMAALVENKMEAFVEPTTFPSWKELCDRFARNSRHVTLRRMRSPASPKPLPAVTAQCVRSESTCSTARMGWKGQFHQGVPQSPYLRKSQVESQKKDLEEAYGPKPLSN